MARAWISEPYSALLSLLSLDLNSLLLMMMNSKRGVGIEKAKTAAEQQQQQQESKRESALHISFSKSSCQLTGSGLFLYH